jgi:hypothetical protein
MQLAIVFLPPPAISTQHFSPLQNEIQHILKEGLWWVLIEFFFLILKAALSQLLSRRAFPYLID